jgi:hypothetical protein
MGVRLHQLCQSPFFGIQSWRILMLAGMWYSQSIQADLLFRPNCQERSIKKLIPCASQPHYMPHFLQIRKLEHLLSVLQR